MSSSQSSPTHPTSSTQLTMERRVLETIAHVTRQTPTPHPLPARPQLDSAINSQSCSLSPDPPFQSGRDQDAKNDAIRSSGNSKSSQSQISRCDSSQSSRKDLPPDILHILQSDFVSGSCHLQDRDQQIQQAVEGLRVETRLNRYRRVRDQLADSQDDDTDDDDVDQLDQDEGSSPMAEDECQDECLDSNDALSDIDGSGDEERTTSKHHDALSKLKMEIEQMIGVPEERPYDYTDYDMAEPAYPVIKSQRETPTSFSSSSLALSLGNSQRLPQYNLNPRKQSSDLSQYEHPTHSSDNEASIDSNKENLLAGAQTMDFTSDSGKSNVGHQAALAKISKQCPSNSQAHSGTSNQQHSHALSRENSTYTDSAMSSNPQRNRENTNCQTESIESQSSSSESSDDLLEEDESPTSIIGPTTLNELPEPPPHTTQVPFTTVPEEDFKLIAPFGTLISVIGNVLVIKGTTGLGYDKVLDEGSLVCRQDGFVIGKIFETFGSVTDPHYSIRLPTHIQSSISSGDATFSPGMMVFYVPNYASFVFTSDLQAQPKGTDASNFYDEELSNPGEVDFSDDEAEAAYLRSRKLARKKATINSQAGTNRHQVHVLNDDPNEMFIKHEPSELNYGDASLDQEACPPTGTEYNLLERPKGGLHPPSSLPWPRSIGPNQQSTPSSVSERKPLSGQRTARRGARGARGRDSRKFKNSRNSNHVEIGTAHSDNTGNGRFRPAQQAENRSWLPIPAGIHINSPMGHSPQTGIQINSPMGDSSPAGVQVNTPMGYIPPIHTNSPMGHSLPGYRALPSIGNQSWLSPMTPNFNFELQAPYQPSYSSGPIQTTPGFNNLAALVSPAHQQTSLHPQLSSYNNIARGPLQPPNRSSEHTSAPTLGQHDLTGALPSDPTQASQPLRTSNLNSMAGLLPPGHYNPRFFGL
ncbi:hypothetical protein O181_060490 [Austropuccinia psidii MF-1]|uniref:H/ACA ribonucleoprotein complex non-core subunit NAF1 n=1 Tax=Austropuccinia psidii MF-1 TaxID=1389203 RepID=A0A9Q3EKK9_9BASI|nr:hypothetical protein [Austropuccinia psidii MF-1]